MQVFNYKTVKAEKAECCPKKTQIRLLITKEMGAPNFVMRLFEIDPDGYTPFHTHAWEHEVFILEGEGTVFDGKNSIPLQAGDVVFVPPNELHQFKNDREKPLKFLCLIPIIEQ
ncbi:MAG TPA: cupin domain-containing protein [Candidatus Bathyarchaeia archaeon]